MLCCNPSSFSEDVSKFQISICSSDLLVQTRAGLDRYPETSNGLGDIKWVQIKVGLDTRKPGMDLEKFDGPKAHIAISASNCP